MSYFPLQTKCQVLFCCAQSLAYSLGTNTLHPPACPCLIRQDHVFLSQNITYKKTPLTVSIPKQTQYQPKGLKANQTKTDDWENSTLLPQSVAHQAKLCHRKGRREGKARLNPCAIYLIPLVQRIYLSLELYKLLFLASPRDAAMP